MFSLGDYTLASGAKSRWKLECDALTNEDWQGLAEMVRLLVGSFASVEGVPSGGLKLAECLQNFRDLKGPHLIVDDVLTTGGSMENTKMAYLLRTYGPNVPYPGVRTGCIGAVVFARGQCPSWIKAVFQMPESFWLKPRYC